MIGCSTFLIYEQVQCYPVYIKKTTTTAFTRVSVFSAYKLSLQEKKGKVPREIRTYLLYATSPAPNPLHHSGQYCRIATYIRHSIFKKKYL